MARLCGWGLKTERVFLVPIGNDLKVLNIIGRESGDGVVMRQKVDDRYFIEEGYVHLEYQYYYDFERFTIQFVEEDIIEARFVFNYDDNSCVLHIPYGCQVYKTNPDLEDSLNSDSIEKMYPPP